LYEIQFGPPHSQKINWGGGVDGGIQAAARLAKQIEEFNHPPFTVARNGDKVTKEKATDVLNYVVEDAKKDFTITIQGPGRNEREQLWARPRFGHCARVHDVSAFRRSQSCSRHFCPGP